jgi:hypothetical protein
MSPQWIEVDDEVMAKVQAQAEPFVDSPNDALRKVFGLAAAKEAICSRLPSDRPQPVRGRAKVGELLPMAEYRLPLLRALSQLGGSAPAATVRQTAGAMLADKLTAADRAPMSNGEERWSNRLGFARLRAIEQGHMRSDSRRGIWELAEAGIEELGRLEAQVHEEERGRVG